MLRRIQKLICALVIALLAVSALTPALAQSVKATVSSSSAKVYKKASKSSAHMKVSKGTTVTVTAVSGSWAKVKRNGKTGYMPVKYLKTASSSKKSSGDTKKSSNSNWKSKVVKMDWFKGGKNVLKKGSYGYIYDIDKGIELRIKRMGGCNHADVEPATAADTAKLLRIAGGSFSWKSHAVILKAGDKYVACGINTEPHGDQTIKNNNYEGQFCLHMTNSITHGSQKENENHQKSIERAYKWAHK